MFNEKNVDFTRRRELMSSNAQSLLLESSNFERNMKDLQKYQLMNILKAIQVGSKIKR